MKLYRQSKSKYWWFDHTFPDGSRLRQSTKQTDKAVARIRANEEIHQHELTEKALVAKGTFFVEYLQWAKPRKKPKVITNEIYIWNKFIEFAGNKEPWLVPVRIIEQFFTRMLEEKYRPATCNLYLRTLRMIFNRAKRWKYVLNNPFDEIEKMRYEPELPRFLTQDELNKFISKTRELYPHLLPLFMFAFLTGLRRSEIFRLQWVDINWEQHLLTIKNTKGKRPRFVPITPMAETILQDHKEEPSPFAVALDRELAAGFRPLNRISTKAEIPPVTLHDLRRTFATYMAEHLSEKLLQQLLGHANYSVTDIFYIGTNAASLREKMKILDTMLTTALAYRGMTQLKIMT